MTISTLAILTATASIIVFKLAILAVVVILAAKSLVPTKQVHK